MELLSRGVDGPDSSFVCGRCVRQLRALEKTLKTVTFMLDAAVQRKDKVKVMSEGLEYKKKESR